MWLYIVMAIVATLVWITLLWLTVRVCAFNDEKYKDVR